MRNYKEATQGPTLVDETNIVLGTKKESRVLSEKEEQNPTPFQIQDTNTKGIKQRLAYRNEELPTGLKPRAGLNIKTEAKTMLRTQRKRQGTQT